MNNGYLSIRQKGMTLIEIMIALIIGAFLLGGVLQIFSSSSQTYRMQDNLSRLQENGRFSMDFISRDIRVADYLGCLRSGLTGLTNKLDPADPAYDVNIHGYDGSNGIAGTNGAAGANLALDAPDTITLRGAFSAGIDIVPPFMVNTAANIRVSSTDGLSQFAIALISDCTGADIFEITNDPTTGGGANVVVHNGGNVAEGPGNINQQLSKTYQSDASVFIFSTVTYFVQNNALFKRVDAGTATELVDGIENMQILYGEDTNGDNTADYFVPAGTAGLNMAQVVSIRVGLLAVTDDDNLASQPIAFTFNGATTTPADRRLRRVFSSTIAVRNRLP